MKHFFKSKFYFIFILLISVFPMKYVFNVSHELNESSKKYISQMKEVEFYQLSSRDNVGFSRDEDHLYSYDVSDLNDFSDDQLLNLLEVPEERWSTRPDQGDEYILPPEQLDYFDEQLSEFEKSKNDVYSQIGADGPLIEYEDVIKCNQKPLRLKFNSIIKNTPALSKLTMEKVSSARHTLPRHCVTHVMNRINFSGKSLATFTTKLTGAPRRNGVKPCVSKEMVNVTYNSIVDVAACLNLNPKDILPKLFNESGLLINTLGYGWDTGVGQLTGVAIKEVNTYYDYYLNEMYKAARDGKKSCQSLLDDKLQPLVVKEGRVTRQLLAKVKDELSQRNSLIAAPENPLKNIVYMSMLNRRNLDVLLGTSFRAGKDYLKDLPIDIENLNPQMVGGKFGASAIYSKFSQLGMRNINLYKVAVIVALAGYNTGNSTAFNMLNEYLDRRIAAKKPLNESHFDFHNPARARDLDGNEKSVIDIAKAFVRAPLIKKGDKDVKIKLQRTKLLHEKMRTAHLLTFPEFIIYNQNNYDRSILKPENLAAVKAGKAKKSSFPSYGVIGGPGYLNSLADKDKELRRVFQESTSGANYCSDPKYLKIK